MNLKKLTLALAAVLAIGFSGCSTVTIPDKLDIEKGDSISLRGKTILLTKIADGKYGNKIYKSSGKDVAEIFVKNLKNKGAQKAVILQTDGDYLTTAKEQKADYVFYVTITHWEHRSSWGFGRPSRVDMTIQIIDVATSKKLSSLNITNRANAFWNRGIAPKKLATKMVKQYFDSFFK